MEKHRVFTVNGWRDFGNIDEATSFHEIEGVGEISTIVIEPQPFNKRDWEISTVEPAVRAHIESTIRPEPFDYISIQEPNTWVDDEHYGAEALAVRAWIRDCWRSVRLQIEPLTQPVDANVIINQLPPLNV